MEPNKYSLLDTHVHIDGLVDLEGAVRRAQSVGILTVNESFHICFYESVR